ncbi:hypothetical protein [Nocardia sp. NPDC050175]|uniref:hypothetical protein n=1 Tax=Nocardia sp. NPDC050175 TaxID=3364317 RepID=UPI00378BBB1D
MFLRRNDTESTLMAMLPELTVGERDAIAARCRLSHAALLLSPRDLTELSEVLAERGLLAGPATPSTVVRGRLAARQRRASAPRNPAAGYGFRALARHALTSSTLG